MILRNCDIKNGSIELVTGEDMLISSYLTGVTVYIVGSKYVGTVADGCVLKDCKVKKVKKSCRK